MPPPPQSPIPIIKASTVTPAGPGTCQLQGRSSNSQSCGIQVTSVLTAIIRELKIEDIVFAGLLYCYQSGITRVYKVSVDGFIAA